MNNMIFKGHSLLSDFERIRRQTETLCATLETEDFGVQSMPDASPPKWHLAHTSWFFEEMLLKPFAAGYGVFNDAFAHLFNSYYESLGGFFTRAERGIITRPTVNEVFRYREHVDSAMKQLLTNEAHIDASEITNRTILGLNHEQQHQELLLTDIKHAFSKNPLRPAYLNDHLETPLPDIKPETKGDWVTMEEGLYETGHEAEAFAYDNEMPRHKSFLQAFRIAAKPVSNADFLAFMEDGGYVNADLWLSDAWATVKSNAWQAPLYWEKHDNDWQVFTLNGMQPITLEAPVCHVSFYEAAAYARWANKRLPTETEWEAVAQTLPVTGNLSNTQNWAPIPDANPSYQFYGDVWEWTSSPYTEYPGYRRLSGPFGEYNGKFMSNQMVLRGGSCLTPDDHIRPSYRNFFYPHTRWQFSGIRLAEDL